MGGCGAGFAGGLLSVMTCCGYLNVDLIVADYVGGFGCAG